MHLLHNQTYLYDEAAPPLKTNWVYQSDGTNFQFLTNWYNGTFTTYPQVGSYMLYQRADSSTTFASYRNNIASTWNQYTVEGWVNVSRRAQTEFQNRMTIGNPSTGNYMYLGVAPYHTTPLDYAVSFTIVQGGSVVWSSSATVPGSDIVLSNNWVYYTMVKTSNNQRFLMLNGATIWEDNSTTFSETINTTTGTNSYALEFGRVYGFQPTVNTLWDMTRISNVARYSSGQTFTPPTTMFTNDSNTWYLSSFENTWTPAPSPT